MLEPKNTLVGLAGQKAWHICADEALPRISGKYLPSQLRTQKAGPEFATTGRGGAAACCDAVAGSAKSAACGDGAERACALPPRKKKSNSPSAEARFGASRKGPVTAMTSAIARRLR